MTFEEAQNNYIVDFNGCWRWCFNVNNNGYGRVTIDGKRDYAHRVFYRNTKGLIPYGMVIDHLCRVRDCVNPRHLEVVTHKENNYRGIGPASKNHKKNMCINGHQFTDNNLYHWKNDRDGRSRGRVCRQCVLDYQSQRKIKKRLIDSVNTK